MRSVGRYKLHCAATSETQRYPEGVAVYYQPIWMLTQGEHKSKQSHLESRVLNFVLLSKDKSKDADAYLVMQLNIAAQRLLVASSCNRHCTLTCKLQVSMEELLT